MRKSRAWVKKEQGLLSELKRHRDRIAESRDAIRELIAEWKEIDDDVTEALEGIDRSIETLSQHL